MKDNTRRIKIPYNIFFLIGLGFLLFPIFSNFTGSGIENVRGENLESTYVEFSFPTRQKEIDVGPGDPIMVQFKGKVRYISPKPLPMERQIILSLNVECVHDPTSPQPNGSWVASNSPVLLVFNARDDDWQDITVNVRATPFERMGVTHNIILGGTWMVNPGSSGNIEPYSLTVTASQFFMLRVSSKHTLITGYPGERRHYSIEIKNQGNGMDAFNIHFENIDSLETAGFAIISYEQKTGLLGPDESGFFSFDVIGPQSFVLWRTRVSEIAMTITSEGSEQNLMSVEKMASSVFYQERGTYYDIEPCLGTMLFVLVLVPLCFYIYKVKKRNKKKIRLKIEDKKR